MQSHSDAVERSTLRVPGDRERCALGGAAADQGALVVRASRADARGIRIGSEIADSAVPKRLQDPNQIRPTLGGWFTLHHAFYAITRGRTAVRTLGGGLGQFNAPANTLFRRNAP